MARQNPTVQKTPGEVVGIPGAQVAFPCGGHEQIMEMPDVNMTPNDGDQKDVPDAPFANGPDPVKHSGGPNSAPAPGMPGA